MSNPVWRGYKIAMVTGPRNDGDWIRVDSGTLQVTVIVKDVFSLTACQNYLQTLQPNPDRFNQWIPYVGATTRFIGMGLALASAMPTDTAIACGRQNRVRSCRASVGNGFTCVGAASHAIGDSTHTRPLTIWSLARWRY